MLLHAQFLDVLHVEKFGCRASCLSCPTVFWSLVFCPSDHFRATMTVVKRRPVRDTNLHHRHDALTPRKKIEARRRRARLRRLSKLAQDALALTLTLAAPIFFHHKWTLT